MASTRYEIKIIDGMKRVSMPNQHRLVAQISRDDWNGERNCGCYIHENALKFWGTDQLVDEITNRLYEDYVTHYGEPDNA
ncbi:hypothetical protein [Vibrio phage VP41s3]|nr:hypothetical protein [Vibrio phage VP41s3]